jgi:DNA-binding LacI/PurR family transcriptional regulator
VIGFDDISLSEYTIPPLTTIRQDFTQIGHELTNLLFAQIDGKRIDEEERILVPAPLIIRSTTGPVRPENHPQ